MRGARTEPRPRPLSQGLRNALQREPDGARLLRGLSTAGRAAMAVEGLSEVQQPYYILAPEIAVPEATFVLKHEETFGLFNHFGDIDTAARHEEGLFHEGTRYLSRLSLTLAGGRPLLLSAAARRDNLLIAADLTNPDVYLDGSVILPRGSLHIYRAKLIWQ